MSHSSVPSGSHMGHKESVKDTARVLGRMYDAIEYRGFAQETAPELAPNESGVPALQRAYRRVAPTRSWATSSPPRAPREATDEVVVLLPRRRPLQHGRLAIWSAQAKLGMDVRIASPKSLWPRGVVELAELDRARDRSAKITISDDVAEAVEGCDVAPYRRVGLDGRGGRSLGGADRTAHALPDQRGRDGRRPATRT